MGDIMLDQPNSLETFLKNTLKDIETKMKEIIYDGKILEILKGGKRLRPLLGSIAFKVCTGGNESSEKYHKFLEGCVGVELAHGASLVHDDIIDGDLNRRGELAFYIKTGIDNAILIGHKMLTIGFDLAVNHGEKFAKLYVDSWRGTLDGQLKEINFNSKDLNDSNISTDSKFFQIYSRIIDLKTATLFSSFCKSAAMRADASEDLSNVLANYGREVGFAYQLADDLVDLEKGEMIDSVVLPLLSRLERKSIKNGSAKAKTLKKKLKKNSTEIKKLYLTEIKKHVMNAERLSTEGIIPTNHYKTFLQQAPTYIINTMLKEIDISL
jgi:geranylgeranyl pyrophosphate synthase